MLTKKDLTQIEGIVQTSIKAAFQDFYDNIFEPFAQRTEDRFEENRRQHLEIRDKFLEADNKLIRIEEKIDTSNEYVSDHEKRIRKLEVVNNLF